MSEKNVDGKVGLESKLNNSKISNYKIPLIDTAGRVSYSLLLGSLLDYCSGLSLTGILASRASATGINSVTSGMYGWWREKCFELTKTNRESEKLRKSITDLLAFNSFQIPIYATAIATGSLVSEGKVDLEKIQNGATYLATISPFIGPTLGWYMDGCRRLLGINSASEGEYN